MLELIGKYNSDCKIFCDNVEASALSLIQGILNEEVSKDVPVRIMSDVHAGKGIVIGFTMPMTNLVNSEWVGVDINCGVTVVKTHMEYNKAVIDTLLPIWDKEIRKVIPMGMEHCPKVNIVEHDLINNANKRVNVFINKYNLKYGTSFVAPRIDEKWITQMIKRVDIKPVVFWKSIGSLGGGNHFIEIGKSEADNKICISIHTGSRNFGHKVCTYWSKLLKSYRVEDDVVYKNRVKEIVSVEDKSTIAQNLKELKEEFYAKPKAIYLEGDYLFGYLVDMVVASVYADMNRETIINKIMKIIGETKPIEIINTKHNYIDENDFMIRKGAIRSYIGEKMVIPFNMRDGILICEGKSNDDWNCSAPHGAGRIMSRSSASKSLSIDEFKETMEGIYSSSVCTGTLDESPMAYKDSKIIEEAIKDTAIIIDRVKPILNIKAIGS